MAKKEIDQFMRTSCKNTPCKLCASSGAMSTLTEMLEWMDANQKIVAIDKIKQYIAEHHDVIAGLTQFRKHLRDGHNAEHSRLWLAVRRMR